MKLLSTLSPSSVFGSQFKRTDYTELDLSVENPHLKTIDLSSEMSIQSYIDTVCLSSKKRVAYGGYLEKRGIYRRSDYFNETDPFLERNIHLGVDLWYKSDTPIYAPIEGKIHSFQDNKNFGDYGPTLILEHVVLDHCFYTLYGHLSKSSIQYMEKGRSIKQGEKIGTLGTPEVNGNYPPHLHFQIILDLQGKSGDYPGVTCLKDLAYYKENCPDPNLLLRIE